MERNTEIDLELYDTGSEKLPDTLKSMGYESLRPGQSEPISCVMMGRDTFCILPTGQGKSLTFAAPTKALGWKTIVFSPLIALMHDQVQSMNRKGIPTAAVNASQNPGLNYTNLEAWKRGDLQMLYVAPERLGNEEFLRAMRDVSPDFVVLDEAHCMSQWSATFRPAYTRCGEFVEEFNPSVVMALTATATKEIIADVKSILKIPNACICRYYPTRANLHLSSSFIADQKALFPAVLSKLREVSGSAIVYCSTVKEVVGLHQYLQQAGESVTFYHGQIPSDSERTLNMEAFMSGRSRICVATNAFGMGIDKPDIEAVIHASPPGSVEAIAQETGRAARDGRKAICHMFSTAYGLKIQEFFFSMSNPDSSLLQRTYEYLRLNANKEDMVARVLVKDIVASLGDTGAEGAVNYLETMGCIERFNAEDKLYVIKVKKSPELVRNKYQAMIVKAIIDGGELLNANEGVYRVSLDFITSTCTMSDDTVKRRLNEMRKENITDTLETPFRGKMTRIIRKPTQEDLIMADKRRRFEQKKLRDVRRYIDMPDSDKHKFLQEYFAV